MELITGSEIQLHGGEDPDSLRGRRIHGVILDEYADMAEEVWAEALRPALADARGWAEFLGKPKSFNHFHALFVKGQGADPEWESWQFKTVDNPFIDPSEILAAQRDMDPRSFRQEFEASFESVSGRAYYAFARTTHVGPVTLQPGIPVALSFDYNVQPATCVLGQRVRLPPDRVGRSGAFAARAAAAA